MIVFMRHAQRGDNEIPMKLSEIPHDPPIIQAAQNTIKNTANQIIPILKQNKINKVKIICSKFLRCLMTAKKIQQILKLSNFIVQQQYTLDDRICQYLRQDWFENYPLTNLIYQTQHLNKYISNLNYKANKIKLNFPQNYPLFHHRVTAFKESLQFPNSDSCLLIVTHGFVVREICFRMNQLPKFQNQIKYCGYAAYKKQTQKEQILIKSKL